jgi:class 3 adenylate cyclase/tetratricopeptide (TPR) repeat protein
MLVCPSCGRENPDGFKFCGFCTAPLDTAPAAPPEERKVVSILFVDLVGFTARSHAADPEDVRAALGPYHALLKREIERFVGTVEKFIGDAVMAVFGAPVAHEDDAERAVRAALRIIEAIAELNQDSALDLSVRAAVNTGEGLVALAARSEAGESMVTGDVVNTASRLQNVAPVNGVLVGELTFRSTKDVIDYEELEPVTVKGKPEPVALWRALSPKSRFGVDAESVSKTPFVGRDYEQTILKETFRRTVRESSPQLVTVVGEPGVGKSRLLSELFSFTDQQEELIFWRQGRSLPYGEGITFWALGEIVKAHAGILESDSSEAAASKLAAAVASVIKQDSEQNWFLSRLGPLVGAETVGGENPQKEESFTAWRRFLEAIAENGPLVLVFEDLHWADPSLLEFIEHLVDWVSGVPMFLVCTARPELYDKHPNWGGGKRNITVLSLAPLNDSETAQLVSSLLSQAVLPAEIHSALLERAGGNPLYAEEFVRMLSDQGILTRKGNVVSLNRDAEIPVPESVHALIAARLDTLTPERKSLLQDASIAGKVFWSGAVAVIGGADRGSVRHGLHELGAKELVRSSRTSSMEGEQEYAFWHALIRDVCYNQIPRASRARKHQAMAAWIEDTAERLEDHAEVLSHHYSTALELARASGVSDVTELEKQTQHFLVAAADRAAKLDPSKALALYRQALELIPPDRRVALRVLSAAGQTCRALGLASEAHDYLERAILGHSKTGDLTGEAIALRRLSLVYRDQGRSVEGRSLAASAVELLEQQEPGEELALAYANIAFFDLISGSFQQALAWTDKALAAPHSNESRTRALDIRAGARCGSGDLEGIQDFEAAITLSEEAGDTQQAASSYQNLGDRLWLIEGPLKGLQYVEKGEELARSHGYVEAALWARMSMLTTLFELGRWDVGLHQANELIAGSQEHDARAMLSGSTLSAAVILFHQGRTNEALSLQESFLPLLREMRELEALAPALAITALMHARSADHATARALVREFEQATENDLPFRARYLPDVLRAASTTNDMEHASGLLVAESDIAYARDRYAIRTSRAILAEAEGNLEQALQLYTEVAGSWNEYGFVLEEGQALLGAGRCLIAAGRKMEASPRLQEALGIFTELGAAPLVAETNDYLKQAIALSS